MLVPDLALLGRQLRQFSPDDPYERAGVIQWTSKRSLRLHELENEHDDPEKQFRVNIRRAEWRGVEFFGFWHTHNGRDRDDCVLSQQDKDTALDWWPYINMMYHPYTRTLIWYQASGRLQIDQVKARVPYLVPRTSNLRY